MGTANLIGACSDLPVYETIYLQRPAKAPSMADRIRSMTDEQLADWIFRIDSREFDFDTLFCQPKKAPWCSYNDPEFECSHEMSMRCAIRWLQSPAE